MKKFYIFIILLFTISCSDSDKTKEVWIKNTQNESIYAQIDGLNNSSQHKLAIIQHGLSSNMKHSAVQETKKVFLDNGYVVITFDSRFSLGKSDNDVEKVKLETFVDDLKTVADWAKNQSFYSEPFALAGHSLGGASVIEFSAEYPQKVNVLIPITPVISGKSWERSCMENLTDFCQQWKLNGVYKYINPIENKTAIIPYAVLESCENYDAHVLAPEIEAKTLLIIAQNDTIVNPTELQDLTNSFVNGKSALIKFSSHNFEKKENQADLYQAINSFLK